MIMNPESKKPLVFFLIVLLLTATFIGLNVLAHEPIITNFGVVGPATAQDYAYLVFQSGPTYYMRSGSSGQIVASGSTAHVVVNWALRNLTSGRTWKEKVVLEGNFTLTGSITPLDYTALNLTDASLKTTVNTLKIIDFRGTAGNHKKYLDIIGGNFKGAATYGSGPETHCAIHTNYADYVTIKDGLYEDFYGIGEGGRGQAIWIGAGSNIKITASIPPGAGTPTMQFLNNKESYAVAMNNAVNSVIENCYVDCANSGTGIWLGEAGSQGCIIRNNEITGWGPTKMSHAVYFGGSVAGPRNQIVNNYCHTSSGGTAIQVKCANALIQGNVIKDIPTDYGICVYVEGGSVPSVAGTRIIGNSISNVYKGIEIGSDYSSGDVEYVTAEDNVISATTGGRAISLLANSASKTRYCNIINNTVLQGAYGVTFSSETYCEYNSLIDNDLRSSSTKLSGRGTSSTFINNLGYNPVGDVTNPVSGSTLVDSGTGPIANNALFTCWQSPKTIYINGGTVSSVQVNGVEVFTNTNVVAVVQPSQTFKIIWSVAPTIRVVGQ